MKNTAVYKRILVVTVVLVSLSLSLPVLASGINTVPGTDDGTKATTGPDSLSNTECKKKNNASVKELEANRQKMQQLPSAPNTNQKIKELPASEGSRQSTGSSNVSFNFLYYLFYKFSVTEFFKTPDYNESGNYQPKTVF